MQTRHAMALGGWLGTAILAGLPFSLGCPPEQQPPHGRLRVDPTGIALDGEEIHVVVRIDRATLTTLRFGALSASSTTADAIALIPDSPDHVGSSRGRTPGSADVRAFVVWHEAIATDCDDVACEFGVTIVVTQLEPVEAPVVWIGLNAESPENIPVPAEGRLEILAEGGEPLVAVAEFR